MGRKLIVFVNESRRHKAFLDHLTTDCESDVLYCELDSKIIKSHNSTREAIDNVINNNIWHATICTYDINSLSFDLTHHGFDLYVCAWVNKINKKMYNKYLKSYNKTKKIPKFIRNILGIKCSNVVNMIATEEIKSLKIYEHMSEIDKDLRYGHNLSKLLLGGLFNDAIMNSKQNNADVTYDVAVLSPASYVTKVMLTDDSHKNYMRLIKLV